MGGETLPEDYEGCENEDGTVEAAAQIACEDGTSFALYQDRYWAVLGGEIKDAGEGNIAQNDPAYAADWEACTGG